MVCNFESIVCVGILLGCVFEWVGEWVHVPSELADKIVEKLFHEICVHIFYYKILDISVFV